MNLLMRSDYLYEFLVGELLLALHLVVVSWYGKREILLIFGLLVNIKLEFEICVMINRMTTWG